jgi:purine-binding chemotaxis protein CheW
MEVGTDQRGKGMQMVCFSLGEEKFGLDIKRVKEVIRVGEITHMPRAPVFLKGVINLRSEVIPIIDLKERFGLPTLAKTEMTRVIVVEIEGKSVGMVVDGASHVMRVAQADIDATSSWQDWLTREYVCGVARVEEHLVVLLNIKAILSPEEMNDLDKSAETADRVPENGAREELHELVL